MHKISQSHSERVDYIFTTIDSKRELSKLTSRSDLEMKWSTSTKNFILQDQKFICSGEERSFA